MKLRSFIQEGDNIPFGHIVVGHAINSLAYETWIYPLSEIVKWWRNKRHQNKMPEWSEKLICIVDKRERHHFDRGYRVGVDRAIEIIKGER